LTDLLQLDYQLFHFINSGCHNPVFDVLMPILRNKYTWLPFYLFLLVFLALNFQKKGFFLFLAMVVTVALTDSISSQLIKKNVMRLRPCKVMEQPKDMHLLVPCGSGYSFPSTHATNHFGMAVFLSLSLGKVFRRVKWPLFFWAASIAFAQVYVGVHFPLDVIVGGALGALIAKTVYVLYSQAAQYFHLVFSESK
jgi:undecaprenyl-diphosphatase